jgi:DNA primase
VPVPTARGLVRFERELDGEVRIVVLPAGRDPDEVIRADPDGWRERIDGALPVMEYVLERVAQESDLSTARGKADAVQGALPLLVEVHDPVERAHYVQRLAHLVHVDEQAVLSQLRRARPSGSRPRTPPPEEVFLPAQEEIVEGYFVALIHRFPHMWEQVPPGVTSLLAREEHRVLVEKLTEGGDAWEDLPAEIQVYLGELASTFQAELDLGVDTAGQSLQECVRRLEILANERQYRQYSYMLAQAEEEGNRELAQEMLRQLSVLSQHRGAISTPPQSRLYPDLRRHLGDEGEEHAAESF